MEIVLDNKFLEKIHFKRIQDVTKYIGMILLTVMFILCAYTRLITFTLVLSIVISIFCVFQNIEDLVCLKIILYPFTSIMSYDFYGPYLIISLVLYSAIFVRTIFNIINKKTKNSLSYLVIGLLVLYMIYSMLPIFNRKVGLLSITSFANIFFVAMVFINRNELHFKKLALCFSIFLLLSCVMSIFGEYVRDWRNFLDYVGHIDMDNWSKKNEVLGKFNCDLIPRFKAFYIHSNIFAGFAGFSISLLCYLKYKKQIDDLMVYLLFVPTFMFGYLTISRAYIVVLFIVLATDFIFLIIRDKKESLKTIIPICSIILLTVAVLYKITQFYFTRFESNYEIGVDNSDISEEKWALIMNGELHYDCGRISLYKIYLKFFLNNPINFIFGRGNNFPYIGKTHSHNLIIDLIYVNGIVGILIYLVILFFMFDLKNIKKYWNMDRLSIVIMLFGWFMYELLNTYFSFLWLTIFIVAFYDKSLYKTNQCIENTESANAKEVDEDIKINQEITQNK